MLPIIRTNGEAGTKQQHPSPFPSSTSMCRAQQALNKGVGLARLVEGPSQVAGATEKPLPVAGNSLIRRLPERSVAVLLVALIKLN